MNARRSSLPDPPVVRELSNVLWWLGDSMTIIERAEQIQSLLDIISFTGDKLRKVIAEINQYGATPLTEVELNRHLSYLRAADKLTEAISG